MILTVLYRVIIWATSGFFCEPDTSVQLHFQDDNYKKKKCLTKGWKLSGVKVERVFVPSPLSVAGLKHALASYNPNTAFQRHLSVTVDVTGFFPL